MFSASAEADLKAICYANTLVYFPAYFFSPNNRKKEMKKRGKKKEK
jgi:hypothetical protein